MESWVKKQEEIFLKRTKKESNYYHTIIHYGLMYRITKDKKYIKLKDDFINKSQPNE